MQPAFLDHLLRVVFTLWLSAAAGTLLGEASPKEDVGLGLHKVALAPTLPVTKSSSPLAMRAATDATPAGTHRHNALHNASRNGTGLHGRLGGNSRIHPTLTANETRDLKPQVFSRAVQDVKAAVGASEHTVMAGTSAVKAKRWQKFGKGLYDYDQSQEIATAVIGAISDTVQLWPIPEKMLVFLAVFVILEFLVDYFPWRTIKGGVQPAEAKFKSEEAFESNSHRKYSEHDDADCLGSLSVLTLNVWVNKVQENLEKQIHGIRELEPDVICLQEVFHLDVLEAYRAAFPGYRFIAFGRGHTITALTAQMFIMICLATTFSALIAAVEYVTHGKWRITWLIVGPVVILLYLRIVRHHWFIAFLTGNRTGLAMLVRSDRVELNDKKVECIPFARKALAADQLNLLRPRGFISAPGKLPLREGRHIPVRFCTTHLNQPLEQRIGEGRHRQVRQVLDHCVRDNEFLVLGCDLNATPPGTLHGTDCQSYNDVCKELTDAWVDVNPSDPCRDGLTWDQKENPMCTSIMNNFFYGSDRLRWRCDYIFWRYQSESYRAVQDAIVEDHRRTAAEKKIRTCVTEPVEVQCTVRACHVVFTGQEAVSDHFGVFTIFDIKEARDHQA